MWQSIKGKQIKGFNFHRQKPVDRYKADFICIPVNLIIEVDGSIHLRPDIISNDFEKEIALNRLNLNVLRFTNDEVLHDCDEVIQIINYYIDAFETGNSELFAGQINIFSGLKPIIKSDIYGT